MIQVLKLLSEACLVNAGQLTPISLQADIDSPVPSICLRAYSFGSDLKQLLRVIFCKVDMIYKRNVFKPIFSLRFVDVTVSSSANFAPFKVEQILNPFTQLRGFLFEFVVHI